MTEVIFTV